MTKVAEWLAFAIVLASFGAVSLVPLTAEHARRLRPSLLRAHARVPGSAAGRNRSRRVRFWAALPLALAAIPFGVVRNDGPYGPNL